jgi:hypothetical protein
LILVIGLGLAGLIGWLIVRGVNRGMANVFRSPSTAHGDAEAEPELFEANQAGIWLSLLGAAVVLISVFLPHVQSTRFATVKDNTLIQAGDGWFFVALAVSAAAIVYRTVQSPKKTNVVWVLGALCIAGAIYEGTGDRVRLKSLGRGSSLFGSTVEEKGSPAVGVYAAGVGGLLISIGGGWLAGMEVIGSGVDPIRTRRIKRCPDCAETVLSDARICKHCGYRFPAASATSGD